MSLSVQLNSRFYPKIFLDMDSPIPLHHQLAQIIKSSLVENRVKAGVSLPSMLTLATDLKLNRNTVRQAFSALEDDAVVERSSGKRTFMVTNEFANSYNKNYLPALGIVLPECMEDILAQAGQTAIETVGGIIDKSSELGFATMLIPLPEDGENIDNFSKFFAEISPKLNGLIFLGETPNSTHNAAFEIILNATNIPQVFIGGADFRPHMASVTVDLSAGFLAAAEHLSALGHRRVVSVSQFVQKKDIFQLQTFDRAGVMAESLYSVFGQNSVTTLENCTYTQEDMESLKEIMLSSNPPTALIFSDDTLCKFFVPLFEELELRIPEDLSIISYDNSKIASANNWTSIDNPRRLKGKIAVEMIAKARIEDIEIKQLNRVITTSVIIRQSTDKIR